MNEFYERRAKTRLVERTVYISRKMIEEIESVTHDHLSVSAFVRCAIHDKLEKIKKQKDEIL